MEHLKHNDLKRMLFMAIGLGCCVAFFYGFSLEKYLLKIPRFDVEILQNFQITQKLVKSNFTNTQDNKKTLEITNVVSLKSDESVKNVMKEVNGSLIKEQNADRPSRNLQDDTSQTKKKDIFRKERLNICSLNDTDLGPVFINKESTDILKLKEGELEFVKPGGQWTPTKCTPRAKLAVIVPFRRREEHLAIFLRHMHKFLKTQKIRYRIFVIEQDDEYEFNRGKLMNVGFKEALNTYPFNCFVFHDIDLLPEDTRNDYACPHSARHMSVSVDKFDYKLLYEALFGGVEMFKTKDYQAVNGFSNSFWGWGGEDDNLYFRSVNIIGHITRPSMTVGRYQMLKHVDMGRSASSERHTTLRNSKNKDYISKDGLSSSQYKVNRKLELPLFTLIKVDLQKHEDRLFGVLEPF